MAQYIDKGSLVAEIERQQRRCDILHQSNDVESRKTAAIQNGVYCSLLSFVNTLEAKEVDLEKETDKWYNTKASKEFENVFYGDIEECAKHFFELGLNAQQNINIDITSIDKVMEENGVDPNSKEAKVFKESYYIALEKLKAHKG